MLHDDDVVIQSGITVHMALNGPEVRARDCRDNRANYVVTPGGTPMEIVLRKHLNVLTVIFDSELRSLVKLAFEDEGHCVLECHGYHQAAAKLRNGPVPDVVLVECGKKPSDILGFRELSKGAFKDRLVLISGREHEALHKEARNLGIRKFLMKPVSPSEVRSIITDLHRVIESESSATKRDNSAWWALYTSHRHEKSVARILQAKEFDVFLPLYQSLRRWTDRDKMLSLPLFPGYVFVRGGMNRRLEVVTTPGVQMILFYGERVAIIPDVEIHAIQKMLEEPYHAEPHPYLKCGERVRVKRGTLEGIEGILVRKKNLYRLVLSVDLLARSVAVEIDAADLEPIDSRSGVAKPPPERAAGIGASDEQSLRTA
jgi:transcription antitermination factor NusG